MTRRPRRPARKRSRWQYAALLFGPAVVMVSASLVSVPRIPDPWGACPAFGQPDPLLPCYSQAADVADGDVLADALAVHLEAARSEHKAAKGHACRPSAEWPEGVVPAGFVVRDTDGTAARFEAFDVAWSHAKDGKVWILEACAR